MRTTVSECTRLLMAARARLLPIEGKLPVIKQVTAQLDFRLTHGIVGGHARYWKSGGQSPRVGIGLFANLLYDACGEEDDRGYDQSERNCHANPTSILRRQLRSRAAGRAEPYNSSGESRHLSRNVSARRAQPSRQGPESATSNSGSLRPEQCSNRIGPRSMPPASRSLCSEIGSN